MRVKDPLQVFLMLQKEGGDVSLSSGGFAKYELCVLLKRGLTGLGEVTELF